MRLRDGARKTIEDEPVTRVRLINAIGNDCNDNVIGHEFTARHDIAGTQADRRACLDRCAQHVTGGKLYQAMLGDEALCLSTFAGPRWAEQHQSHRRRPRSFDRLIRPSYWWANK